jgi:hypothetical protein
MRASSCVLDASTMNLFTGMFRGIDLTRSRFIQSYYLPVLVLSPDFGFIFLYSSLNIVVLVCFCIDVVDLPC